MPNDFQKEIPEVMTIDEAAQLLRVNEKTLREAIRRGEVPAGRIGKCIRLYKAAVVQWLQSAAAGDEF